MSVTSMIAAAAMNSVNGIDVIASQRWPVKRQITSSTSATASKPSRAGPSCASPPLSTGMLVSIHGPADPIASRM